MNTPSHGILEPEKTMTRITREVLSRMMTTGCTSFEAFNLADARDITADEAYEILTLAERYRTDRAFAQSVLAAMQ